MTIDRIIVRQNYTTGIQHAYFLKIGDMSRQIDMLPY